VTYLAHRHSTGWQNLAASSQIIKRATGNRLGQTSPCNKWWVNSLELETLFSAVDVIFKQSTQFLLSCYNFRMHTPQ
jgi:hypothetical protein